MGGEAGPGDRPAGSLDAGAPGSKRPGLGKCRARILEEGTGPLSAPQPPGWRPHVHPTLAPLKPGHLRGGRCPEAFPGSGWAVPSPQATRSPSKFRCPPLGMMFLAHRLEGLGWRSRGGGGGPGMARPERTRRVETLRTSAVGTHHVRVCVGGCRVDLLGRRESYNATPCTRTVGTLGPWQVDGTDDWKGSECAETTLAKVRRGGGSPDRIRGLAADAFDQPHRRCTALSPPWPRLRRPGILPPGDPCNTGWQKGQMVRMAFGVVCIGPLVTSAGGEMAALLVCGPPPLSPLTADPARGAVPRGHPIQVTVPGDRVRPGLRIHRSPIPPSDKRSNLLYNHPRWWTACAWTTPSGPGTIRPGPCRPTETGTHGWPEGTATG